MISSTKLSILALALVGAVLARPQFPGGPPPGMSAVPPPIAAVLPPETLARLEAIHADSSLSELEKHKAIDTIMVNLPEEVHDRIPPPPGFAQLPAEVQAQLKTIHRDKNLDFQERQAAIHGVLENLAPEFKRLLPPPPPGFPQRRQ
ncbi:DUF148 domain-containing protein [Caenorhabditis elegans]|uniref:DUF148 domain-containing protein n=1 Tax=Caenorhabditis elegans TaxID=6239 RepID=Q9N2X6_CAEEL|nr:DUF148 domain-containing protein [Caenorhabditis elegans]CCD73312.1 DUF148 domain-containing protein [Caenorhabditis elegans]|eukprot:NP_503408.1 Uncharacterized protein CELE_Y75B7AR.1 [Caenorhabditis elegans]